MASTTPSLPDKEPSAAEPPPIYKIADIGPPAADPVRAYLDHHATGLPATAGQLWITWLVLAAVLFVAAVCGSRGGRIGWCLLGALTTAMAYAGTAGHGQGIAAGLTAGIWAVLAVPAFAHGRSRGDTTIVNPPAPEAS